MINLLDMGPSGLRKAKTLALNESIVVKLGWAWGLATLFPSLSHEFFSLRHTQLNVLHSAQLGQISQATMWPEVPVPQCTNPWLDKAQSKGGHSLEWVCWGLLWSETCFVSGVPFVFLGYGWVLHRCKWGSLTGERNWGVWRDSGGLNGEWNMAVGWMEMDETFNPKWMITWVWSPPPPQKEKSCNFFLSLQFF